MQVKKNPNVDLNRNSSLYFVIGLTLVLFLTWRALEYKTYPSDNQIVELLDVDEQLDEEVPITERVKTPPPPPPPAAPEIIEVVEDNEEIEETIIESTETNQDVAVEEVMDVDDVEVGEEEEEISIPFSVIENVPVFPGCEKLQSNTERKKCFQEKMQAHIRKEFRYPQSAAEMGVKGRVFVLFTIDRRGLIANLTTRGPDPRLEREAARIVGSLPKMTPGSQRGKSVSVPYSVPINFVLQQ